MHGGFLTMCAPSQVVNPADLADGATNGAAIDMKGWDGVAFLIPAGVLGSGGGFDAKVQESNASDFSTGDTAHDITGAALVTVADTGDNKLYVLDVFRPGRRYVRVVVTVAGTGVTSIIGAIGIRYRSNGTTLAPTQDATVAQNVLVVAN